MRSAAPGVRACRPAILDVVGGVVGHEDIRQFAPSGELHRTAHQPVTQGVDEGFSLRVDLGQVVLRALDLDGRAQVGGLVFPGKGAVLHRHAALVPHAALRTAVAREQLHGHGVEHLVADHHALHAFRQRIDPAHHL